MWNKNDNAGWVARVIVDKSKNNSSMKLNEVAVDVRLSLLQKSLDLGISKLDN